MPKPIKKQKPTPSASVEPMKDEPDIVKASRINHAEDVKKALANNPKCINDSDEDGMTAHHWAAINLNKTVANILFSHEWPRASLKLKDRWERSVLDLAYASNDRAFIEIFQRHEYPEFYNQPDYPEP